MTLGDFFRVLEQDAMELLAFAQAMHDPATSDRFVLELGQALGDDAFVAEVWEEFGGRSLPPSEPEAAAKARLDLPLHEGGEPLVELLEAAPMDEPARRRDRLEERAALFEQLEQAADRARFSPAEHELCPMQRKSVAGPRARFTPCGLGCWPSCERRACNTPGPTY